MPKFAVTAHYEVEAEDEEHALDILSEQRTPDMVLMFSEAKLDTGPAHLHKGDGTNGTSSHAGKAEAGHAR